MKLLHILNGESSLSLFKKAGIEGDNIVMRDVLCEGPSSSAFRSKAFIEERTHFMCKQYNVEEEDFVKKCFLDFEKLEASDWDECVLWFEYDLFCQVNMMAVLSGFALYPEKKVSLICVGEQEGTNSLIGLGELAPESYSQLYASRVVLSWEDLIFTTEFWQAFTSPNPTLLKKYSLPINSTYVYLPNAIRSHFQRFPNSVTGIGKIEKKILDYIQSGINSNHSIVGKLLNEDWVYGFGDLQYFNILERMSELYHMDDGLLEINQAGADIISGNSKYKGVMYDDQYLGGLRMADFEYDAKIQKLVPK
jgi:hypothetical protein